MPPRFDPTTRYDADAPDQIEHTEHDGAPLGLVIACAVLVIAVIGVGSYAIWRTKAYRVAAPTAEADVRAWTRRLGQDPVDVESLVGLGYAYQLDGRYEDALERYDQALTIDEDNLAALYNSGVCLLELGRDDEGVKALLKVHEIAPDHVLAAIALGEYYLDRGEYAQTIAVCAVPAARHPEVADIKVLYARALEKAGRPAEAAAAYEDALRVVPAMTEARSGLARVKAASR